MCAVSAQMRLSAQFIKFDESPLSTAAKLMREAGGRHGPATRDPGFASTKALGLRNAVQRDWPNPAIETESNPQETLLREAC